MVFQFSFNCMLIERIWSLFVFFNSDGLFRVHRSTDWFVFFFVRSTAKLLNTWATWRIHRSFGVLEVWGVWSVFTSTRFDWLMGGCIKINEDPWLKFYMKPISHIQSEEDVYNMFFPLKAWFVWQKWTTCWHFKRLCFVSHIFGALFVSQPEFSLPWSNDSLVESLR